MHAFEVRVDANMIFASGPLRYAQEVDEFRQACLKGADLTVGDLTLDMTDVPYMTTSAPVALIDLHDRLAESGRRLLVRASPFIKRELTFLGLDTILDLL